MRSIDQAMEEASAWADLPGVVSVAAVKRDGRDVIEVRVSGPSPETARRIPASVQGHAVVVLGFEPPISAQPGPDAQSQRNPSSPRKPRS